MLTKNNPLSTVLLFLWIFAFFVKVSSSTEPSFEPRPNHVSVQEGDKATLLCSVTGLGTKSILWKKKPNPSPLSIGDFIFTSDHRFSVRRVPKNNEWNLIIKDVRKDDTGTYECVVSSKRTYKREVVLRVKNKRVLDTTKDNNEFDGRNQGVVLHGNTIFTTGSSIVLTCNASGLHDAPEDVDWFINGVIVRKSNFPRVNIKNNVDYDKKILYSTLEIKRSIKDDEGIYVCRGPHIKVDGKTIHVVDAETTTQQVTTVAGTERHDISCDSDSISIFIPTQLLLSSDQLAWRDPHCKATNNGSHFISTVSHTDCGTTVKFTKDEVIFQNALTVSHQTISRAASNGTIDFGGSNTPETIPVQCIYPRRQNISMAYRPAQSHVRFYEKRYGHMDVELEQFHSDKFTATYPARSYPLEVPINKDLYFRVHAMDSNSSDVALRVDKCVATPSVLPAYGKMYQLIDQGCPASPAVKMYPSSYDEVKFSVTAFEFSSSPGSVVYVHCQVSVCPAMDPKCLTGCIKRQRRDVSSPEDSSHLVSGGPYLLVAEEGSVSVPSVVAAVCACIAVVAAVFAVIGWRRKVRVSKLSSEQ